MLNKLFVGTAKLDDMENLERIKETNLRPIDVDVMFRKLVGGRIKIELAYYKLVNIRGGRVQKYSTQVKVPLHY